MALVRGGAKEKVVRAGLLAAAVLLQAPAPDVAPDLLDLGLHKLVAVRALQARNAIAPAILPLMAACSLQGCLCACCGVRGASKRHCVA